MTATVETKAQFLYNVFDDWRNGSYRDEPLNSILIQHDLTQAICTLFASELLDLDDNADYSIYVNGAYDTIFPLLENQGS